MPGQCADRRTRDRRGRLRPLLTTTVLALAVSCLASCAGTGRIQSSRASVDTVHVGVTLFPVTKRTQVPALVGTTLTGAKVTLSSGADQRIVVLNVWASWCAPCRQELPVLAAMARRPQSAGIRFLGLNEHDTRSAARAFVAAAHCTYPQLADEAGSLLARLRVLPQAAIPSTLVLDRHGRVAARVIGPVAESTLSTILNGLQAES